MLWLLDSERFYNIPLWDCLQQILLKTLPPNISLSFEGEFDIWKLSKDLTYKEPSVMYEVWVIFWVQSRVWPRILLVFISGVFLGQQSPRQGTPKAGTFATSTLDFPALLYRSKGTDFENSGGYLSGLFVERKKKNSCLMDVSHLCCMWYLLMATAFQNDGSCPDWGKYICSKLHSVTLSLLDSLGWRGKV